MKVVRNRLILKTVAVFFATEILMSALAPAASWALTSGPTAPEYTSFEPIDTTDILDLSTGDLAYNIPLIEVPGPVGGYPLSLSYHAGIMPEEEASWVGLGWTLNPGALNRMVNGYPDDQLGSTRKRTDHDSGGERNTFTVGVGYPGIYYGMSVSNDSNLGTGVGMDFHYGVSKTLPKTSVGVKAGLGFGMNSYGESYAGLDASVTVGKGQGLAVELGTQTNFKSVSFSGNLLQGGYSLISTNVSAGGVVASTSVGGISQVNSKAAAWNTTQFSFDIPIPISKTGLSLILGYKYHRWHMHESSNVKVVGALHAEGSKSKNADTWAFDSYALIDAEATANNFRNNDPEKSQGGSFPAFDNYSVNAQGLNGSIAPEIFTNGTLYRQNLKTASGNNYLIQYRTTSPSFYLPVNFRFKGEFTNTHGYSGGEMIFRPHEYLNSAYVTSQQFSENLSPSAGYNPATDHLAGSRHIEWFSNQQIQNGSAKDLRFIDHQTYSDRALAVHGGDVSSQIGGFMITNQNGVTYHYSLPVYGYGEVAKSFVKGKENDKYQINEHKEPYAYTWLLTAVTGPDFVDRNNDGRVDSGDWGYWVKFDYGMWSDAYIWRNPGSGTHNDLDNNVKFFSYGSKELYYLNSISTKTHTALFEKELRADAKGVAEMYPNSAAGGYGALPVDGEFSESGNYYPPYIEYSVSTLKLNNVFLLKNEDLDGISSLDALKSASAEYKHDFQFTTIRSKVHLGDNVLDKHDLNVVINTSTDKTYRDAIKEKSLRVISFDHNYNLQDGPGDQGVPNSFDPGGTIYSKTPNTNVQVQKLGKLTLNQLTFSGKGGVGGLTPPMKFEYDKNPQYKSNAVDVWGSYKSDFDQSEIESTSHFTTTESSKNVDAWSLTDVITPTGARIEFKYESDDYVKPVLYKTNNFHLTALSNGTATGKMELEFDGSLNDLNEFFKSGDRINLSALDKSTYKDQVVTGPSCSNTVVMISEGTEYLVDNFILTVQSTKIVENKFYVVVEDLAFWSAFNGGMRQTKYARNHAWDGSIFFVCDGIVQQGPECSRWVVKDCDGNPSTPNVLCLEYYQGIPLNNCEYYDLNFNSKNTLQAGHVTKIGNAEGDTQYLGGGIRVSEISVKSLGSRQTTKYEYTNPVTGLSSGVTSFEPGGLDQALYLAENVPAQNQLEYEAMLNDQFVNVLKIARELPSPGIMYQYVTVQDMVQHEEQNDPTSLLSKQVYEFVTFDERMVERVPMERRSMDLSRCLNELGVEVPCQPATPPDGENTPFNCFDSEGNAVPCSTTPGSFHYSAFMINNFTAWLGALKSISTYGPGGQILQKIENQFLHEGKENDQFKEDLKTKFGNQGKISQAFTEYRSIRNPNGTYQDKPVFSIKSEFPLVNLGQKVTNYKSGISTTTTNLAFDFYTGSPTKVLQTDGYGNSFVTETVAAYTIPEYSGMANGSQVVGMGLKVRNMKNRNMLSQKASTTVYKVDPHNYDVKTGLVSATVHTWSDQIPALEPGAYIQQTANQIGIWRTHASYRFIGDDNIPLLGDGLHSPVILAFNAWKKNDPVPLYWEKTGEATLYDVNSNTLELKDANDKFVAKKMSFDQSQIMATMVNGEYREFGYSGAEDVPDNGMFGSDVYVSGTNAPFSHTGLKAVSVEAHQTAFTFYMVPKQRTYRVSVWSTQPTCEIKYMFDTNNPVIPASVKHVGTAGSWHLLEADITIDESWDRIAIWCAAGETTTYLDDFRVCPVDAPMVSYVYNEFGELSHILDNNNLFTEYVYDAVGRLTEVHRETFNREKTMVSKTIYHHATE